MLPWLSGKNFVGKLTQKLSTICVECESEMHHHIAVKFSRFLPVLLVKCFSLECMDKHKTSDAQFLGQLLVDCWSFGYLIGFSVLLFEFLQGHNGQCQQLCCK